MFLTPRVARKLAKMILPAEVHELVSQIDLKDSGHGYDSFGMHRDYVALGLAIVYKLHSSYFRVTSYNIEHLPSTGNGVIAANHSGTIPTDAMMLWADVLLNAKRVARPVADHFVPSLPYIGLLFARGGMVGGSRGNAQALLSSDELLMIFPEGVGGIGKHPSKAYELQRWHLGHAELAIRHSAPVYPVGIVGAEEQMPQLGQIDSLGKLLGLPYMPIPATPLPLPVRYHLHYGPPLRFDEEYTPDQADDPEVVREAAARVRDEVDRLIRQGLEMREGIFA